MKIRRIWDNFRNNEKLYHLITYLFVGGATTVVRFAVTNALFYFAHMPTDPASTLGIAAAVLFAYFANKIIVFRSHVKGVLGILREMLSFFASRAITMAFEIICVHIFATRLQLNLNIVMAFIAVVVMILNYILSKFFVFFKKRGNNS